ncbi:hypothetical protein PHYPSEUDO_012233 [Phytophthora pseudosyringae]|uniref:Uncharacterized protein n=1 Tax=Phytophthora pseudosyringae TaxID=221518 RepID=A0A8T1V7Y7_9STRA|nr:hypothetical protein PHYPSEUDO_012233 [Phytophthora pseudosyringae]
MFAAEKSFAQIWRELVKKGWKYKKATLLSYDQRYLPPVGNQNGVEGVDFFVGEASLLQYCRRQGWLAFSHPTNASAPTSAEQTTTNPAASATPAMASTTPALDDAGTRHLGDTVCGHDDTNTRYRGAGFKKKAKPNRKEIPADVALLQPISELKIDAAMKGSVPETVPSNSAKLTLEQAQHDTDEMMTFPPPFPMVSSSSPSSRAQSDDDLNEHAGTMPALAAKVAEASSNIEEASKAIEKTGRELYPVLMRLT